MAEVQHIYSGDFAPATAPQYVGAHYVATVDRRVYFACGTNSVDDWLLMPPAAIFGDGNPNIDPVPGVPGQMYIDNNASFEEQVWVCLAFSQWVRLTATVPA